MKKTILILHSEVPDNAPADELDTILQAEEVEQALQTLGYHTKLLPFTANIEKTIAEIKKVNPSFAFNLVETMKGDGQLIYFAPAILDHLKIPYTGCSKDSIYLTSHKILSKELMMNYSIPTPLWVHKKPIKNFIPGYYIFKTLWEHASVGLDSNSVKMVSTAQEAQKIIQEKKTQMHKDFFAEQYIDGREFNIAILSGQVLPIPEICFHNYKEDQFKIVDYKAKWDENSNEYKNTVRVFKNHPDDEVIFRKMKSIAIDCWQQFDLKGYARIDFRVDSQGNPYVLEINANPCIASNAGFFSACGQIQITYPEMIQKIIDDIEF